MTPYHNPRHLAILDPLSTTTKAERGKKALATHHPSPSLGLMHDIELWYLAWHKAEQWSDREGSSGSEEVWVFMEGGCHDRRQGDGDFLVFFHPLENTSLVRRFYYYHYHYYYCYYYYINDIMNDHCHSSAYLCK